MPPSILDLDFPECGKFSTSHTGLPLSLTSSSTNGQEVTCSCEDSSTHTHNLCIQEAEPSSAWKPEELSWEGGQAAREERKKKGCFSLVTRVRELHTGAPQWQRRLPLPWTQT